MPEDYAANSHISKEKSKKAEPSEEKPKIEKVVTGTVKTRKKPLGEKIKEVFFGASAKATGRYILAEVMLPAFRNLIVDAGQKGIERAVYGDQISRPGIIRPQQQSMGPRITYNRPVDRGTVDPRRAHLPDQISRPGNRDPEVIFSHKADAIRVLDLMGEQIQRYGVISLSDFHEMVGLETSHIENKWGWEDIRFAEIRQVREGFLLDLPEPDVI